MIDNNKLNYRRNGNNDIVVTNSYGKSVNFPKAQKAYRDGDNVVVVSSLGHKITVDKFCIRHW